MKLILATPGLDPKDRKVLEHALNKALGSIARHLGTMGPQQPYLRAHANTDKQNYHLTLSLRMPDHPVVVQKSGIDLHQIISQCEQALKKEVRRMGSRIRRDHLNHRRQSQRRAFEEFSQGVRRSPAAANSHINGTESSPIFAALRPLLGPMYNHAREIIRTAQVAGELPVDYLSPDDLVNQALLHVAEAGSKALADPQVLERRLFHHIDRLLAEEVARQVPDGQQFVSIEQPAPEEESRWQLGEPEEDEVEYFQPFQALRMEDVLIDDHAVDPEHHMSDIEQHRLILKRLAAMHSKARSAFFLSRVEGFDVYEIAMIQNRPDADVERDIAKCVEVLKEGLQRVRAGTNGNHVHTGTAKATSG